MALPTDTWIICNEAGQELAQVDGATREEAIEAALKIEAVRESQEREGGLRSRRLTDLQVKERTMIDKLAALTAGGLEVVRGQTQLKLNREADLIEREALERMMSWILTAQQRQGVRR